MASEDILIDVGVGLGNSVSKLGDFNKSVDRVGDSVGRSSGKLGGLGNMLGGLPGPLGLAVGGVVALAAGLGVAIKAASDEAVGITRMNQALKNAIPNWDGNASAVEAYISKQEKLAFADDELRDSLSHLVGQTKNLGEAQALQATAMDLARAKGISLEAATRAVGKVDQESIGILKKLGIQVTDNMTKEEALTAIRQASAGQAEAYANTAAGSMERLQTSFGNAIENIGGVLLPMITDGLAGVADFVGSDGFQGALTGAVGFIVDGFKFWIGVIQQVSDFLSPLVGVVTNFVGQIQAGRDPLAAFGALVGNIATVVADLTGKVLKGIADAIPGILAKLGEWGKAFVDWIGPRIPPMLAELGKLAGDLLNWAVNTALPKLIQKLGEWGAALWKWVSPMIPPMLLELGKILLAIGTWIITTALPAIILKLAEWGGALLGWIGKDVLPFLGGKLGEIWTAISTWIGTAAGNIVTEAKKIGSGIIDGIKQGFDNMVGSLKAKLQSIIDGLLDMMPDWLRDWLGIGGGGKSGQTTGGGDSFSRGAPPIGGSPIGGHSFGGGGGGGRQEIIVRAQVFLDGRDISRSVAARTITRGIQPNVRQLD